MDERSGADVLLDIVNNSVSDLQYYRKICEYEAWRVEGQQVSGGGVIPLISDEGGLGTIRLFPDMPAVERWLETVVDLGPRPFLTALGADVLGGMPDAVQHVVLNPGGPITLRILPDRVGALRQMGTAVLAERMLRTRGTEFADFARTMLRHKGYRLVVDDDGIVATDTVAGKGPMLLAFTAEDCAEAYLRARPERRLHVETLPGPDLFRRLADHDGEVVSVVLNPCEVGLRTAISREQVETLADVVYME